MNQPEHFYYTSMNELFSYVLKHLTKANEIKSWFVIVENTIAEGKKSRAIDNETFIEAGISRRDQVIKSTNELVNKGLIFKVKDLKPSNEHIFRYSINFEGVRNFTGTGK